MRIGRISEDDTCQVEDDQETMAMFSRGTKGACTTCEKSGQKSERCRIVIGYPGGHPKANQ